MKIYLNGKLVPREEARIPVFDHGLLYGDGVFEGIRVYGGRVFRLDEHVARLYASARSIRLDIPLSPAAFKEAILETVRANQLRDGYVRPVVTRGEGDLGLNPASCSRPNVFIIASTIQLYPADVYERGIRVATAATRKTGNDALPPQVKSLNYLNQILAKLEANEAGVAEALMLTREGFVAECTADNFFLIRGTELLTPPVYLGILAGITRQVVLELAPSAGLSPREVPFTRHDAYVADEAFVTGTGAELVPVVELDGRPIGAGRPGPKTMELIHAFHELVAREGTPAYP